ncbi:signal peptidase II [Alloscardovia criceti]|uniref:signal peptidase II n=1 Tax=Alloscardovia criceti TaxID=356828 RepID=UPI000369D398|nr:signal peptidase II [Alloscardovia criceti]
MVQTSPRRSHIGVAVFVSTVILGLVLDQWTKSLALTHLTTSSNIPLLGDLITLTLVHNPGATMGVGSGVTWIISLFAILASLVFSYIALKTTNAWWSFVLALTVSGAVGNIIDRVIYAEGFLNGTVVDFINYGPFVGNVADIYLTVAAIAIIVTVVRGTKFEIPFLDNILYAEDSDEAQQTETEEKSSVTENSTHLEKDN